MDELTRYSATQLAGMMRRRDVSPVEVVEAHLRRIERVNPRLNAVVTLAPDALERARAAEAALMRREAVGVLEGLPVTVKDTIETGSLRTSFGTLVRARYVPSKDAPSVARLRAAGAILLGKTNASEMALDYTADNPVFGRTNNPLDGALTPGGSSGGCAAAVGACLTAASLGSDLVGSIRIPAHFCGVTGLKPTSGRIPGGGHFPPVAGPFALAASLGPLARRVEDLTLMFDVLSGSKLRTLQGEGRETDDATRAELRGQGVAWYTDDGVAAVSEATRRAVESAALALRDAGLVAFERRPPHVERGSELWLKLFSYPTEQLVRATFAGREEEAGGSARRILERAAARASAPTIDEYFELWSERDRLRAELVEWMESAPLLVAPVGAVAAYPHDTRRVTVDAVEMSTFRAFSYAQTFNAFDLPAVSVPAGRTPEGLPVGVQIVGRPFAELSVLAAARIVEEALGSCEVWSNSLSNPDGNPL